MSIKNAPFNFRFDHVGIYVVMFLEILQTLIKVLIVFFILIVAFGLAFYILLSRVRTKQNARIVRLNSSSKAIIKMSFNLTFLPNVSGKSFSLQHSAHVCDAYIRHDVG